MTEELKVAKSNYKNSLKNKELYRRKRDEIVMRIIESEVPLWGGIKITITKI